MSYRATREKNPHGLEQIQGSSSSSSIQTFVEEYRTDSTDRNQLLAAIVHRRLPSHQEERLPQIVYLDLLSLSSQHVKHIRWQLEFHQASKDH